MESGFGIKELYDVTLRLNNPVEIGKKKYSINETLLSFKTAEIAQVNEVKTSVSATGGYLNRNQIVWEYDKEMNFAISHGVLSPLSWAILSNSKISQPKIKSVSYNESLKTIEENDYCYCILKYCPNSCNEVIGAQPNPCLEPLPMGRRPELMLKPLPPSREKFIFCYDEETGERINNFKILQNRIYFSCPYRKVYVDYTFNYEDKIKVIEVGNRLFNGFLNLTGKMSVKDEKSGEVTTGILEIPKIKLSSSLSMQLGKGYQNSVVSDFLFTGYPDDNVRKEKNITCRITFLDSELTEDYI